MSETGIRQKLAELTQAGSEAATVIRELTAERDSLVARLAAVTQERDAALNDDWKADARVDELEDALRAAEAREEAARKLIEDAERYFGKRMLIEENAPFRVQLRDWLARAALAGREERQ